MTHSVHPFFSVINWASSWSLPWTPYWIDYFHFTQFFWSFVLFPVLEHIPASPYFAYLSVFISMSYVVWIHSPILEKWPYVGNVLSTPFSGRQSDMLLVCPLCGLLRLFFCGTAGSCGCTGREDWPLVHSAANVVCQCGCLTWHCWPIPGMAGCVVQVSKSYISTGLERLAGEEYIDFILFTHQASLIAQVVKNPPKMQEMWVRFLDQKDPLEKGMGNHASILAWRIPWTVEPGGLQSMRSQRVGLNWVTNNFTLSSLEGVASCNRWNLSFNSASALGYLSNLCGCPSRPLYF